MAPARPISLILEPVDLTRAPPVVGFSLIDTRKVDAAA
jgi:hypothetical protein